MADAKKYANIENIKNLLGSEGIGALSKEVQSTEKKVSDILRKLSELEAAAKTRAQEEAARAEEAAREDARLAKERAEKAEAERKAAEEAAAKDAKAAEEERLKQAAKEPPVKEVPEKQEKVEQAEKKEEVKAEVSETEKVKEAEKTQPARKFVTEERERKQYTEKPAERRTNGNYDQAPRQDRPGFNQNRQGGSDRFQGDRAGYDRTRPQGDRPQYGDRQGFNRSQTSDRFGNANRTGERPTFGNRADRPIGTRPAVPGQRPAGTRPQTGAPRFNAGSAPVLPPVQPSKNFGQNKKKTYDKPYVEQKKTVSKRALVKQQVSVSDFDEDKSGYRKLRVKKQKQQSVQTIKIEHAVVTSENIPLKVLSEKLGITAVEITKRLFKEGIAKTINDSLDYDTAAYIASDLGIELEYKPEKTAEEALSEIYQAQTGNDAESIVRPPVVTVMGHVDHGKTSLLDKIRSTNVTEGEAGGITQHIGAYTVNVGGKSITFLDTPGHEAFTAMRARGASVTDIVVLVVAADDGIMPQTVEAINHAKAADVPIIVAVNKMDKPEANLDRVKQGLTNNGLVPEEWGGDAIVCPVSAKTGQGIPELLDTINLVAEIKELKANPNQMARGTIIEAKLDKGKGPVASILIQNGTLHTGDNIISGTTTAKITRKTNGFPTTRSSSGSSFPRSSPK